jgi:hypothetical protein
MRSYQEEFRKIIYALAVNNRQLAFLMQKRQNQHWMKQDLI